MMNIYRYELIEVEMKFSTTHDKWVAIRRIVALCTSKEEAFRVIDVLGKDVEYEIVESQSNRTFI